MKNFLKLDIECENQRMINFPKTRKLEKFLLLLKASNTYTAGTSYTCKLKLLNTQDTCLNEK